MVLKKQIAIASISISFFLSSAIAQDVCSLTAGAFEKKVKINRIPGFFFKVHPDGKYLSYIGTDNNILLDINSGKERTLVGRIDPVWTQDGKYLTSPIEEKEGGNTKIHFFPTEETIKASLKDQAETVTGEDTALAGVYQSIGKGENGYKIITDHNGVSVSNYKPGENKKTSDSNPCSNLTLPTDLPMLSRDGRFLSVYDSTSSSTKIYNIEKSEDCKLAVDLGMPTGKVSFNYDSSQIAFHVDQFSDFEKGYFSGISHDKVKNVVVVNLAESDSGKKLHPLSWALASSHVKPGDGGYYPDFDKDGNIYYLQDTGNYFEFVKTRPDLLEFRPYGDYVTHDQVNCTDCGKKTSDVYKTLAKMWTDLCSVKTGIALDKDLALLLAMDPVKCQEMVDMFWTPSLASSREELKKICPTKKKAYGSDVGKCDNNRTTKAQHLIKARCLMCHRAEKSYEVEETVMVVTSFKERSEKKVKTKKKLPAFSADEKNPLILAKMMQSISPKADLPMPLGSSLDEEEKGMMRDYLYRKLLDVPREIFNTISSPLVEYHLDEESMKKLKDKLVDLSDQDKEYNSLRMDCQFTGKNCVEFISYARKIAELTGAALPESERSQFIQNQLMEARCEASFEVTRDQCLEWKLKDYMK